MTRLRVLAAAILALLLALPVAAVAHEERDSIFPAYDRAVDVPEYRPFAEATPRLVVCKDDSGTRISGLEDSANKTLAEDLLDECAYEHIQAAVDAVTVRGTNIYVLPGEYLEEPSETAPCAADYDGGEVSYEEIRTCGEVINLITVAGDPDGADDPDPFTFDPDTQDDLIRCDSALCDLQIEGLGNEPQDTRVVGGFNDAGDWRKHNGLKADRADGFVLKNMAFELFRENAIYVHETSGYLLDDVEANYNQLYGILTFTSDRGVISNCVTHHNGDSGVYPGSAADVNQATAPPTGPLERWSVEIFGCETYNNALGFSGTAGNSVYFHDNIVRNNGAGYVTDSFVGGHPGMPQDHAFLENNLIYSNNENYYVNVQGEDAPCHREPVSEVGYQDGVVCPAFPVPVGTGVLIAGGNNNFLRNNQIYDNWRNGVMSFYVPAGIRYQGDIAEAMEAGDFARAAELTAEYTEAEGDTSHDNHVVSNAFGLHPAGVTQPNGLDVWWDDQGTGNCWQDNTTTAEGGTLSNNANDGLPTCDEGGSTSEAPDPSKSGVLIPCAEYHKDDNPEPPGCDWFETPTEPAGRQLAPGEDPPGNGAPDGDDDDNTAGALAATGGGSLLALAGIGAVATASRLRRRRDDDQLGDATA